MAGHTGYCQPSPAGSTLVADIRDSAERSLPTSWPCEIRISQSSTAATSIRHLHSLYQNEDIMIHQLTLSTFGSCSSRLSSSSSFYLVRFSLPGRFQSCQFQRRVSGMASNTDSKPPLKKRAVVSSFIYKFTTDENGDRKAKVALFKRSGHVRTYP